MEGLVGSIVPLLILTWQGEKGKYHLSVQCLWMLMFWFFLVQPVSVPITGTLPIFILPLTGCLNSKETCICYFNENIALFILGGMLLLSMNHSGIDRRIALWFLCYGNDKSFTVARLIIKASLAAFILSLISNRLLVTSFIIEIVSSVLIDLESTSASSAQAVLKNSELRYIFNNAIQTASALGSTTIIHSSIATLNFRSIYDMYARYGNFTSRDTFNYLQYTVFAFPVALVMFLLNLAYHMVLVRIFIGGTIDASAMSQIKNELTKHRNALSPKITIHEKLSVFYAIFALVLFFSRHAGSWEFGWAYGNSYDGYLKDAAIAAFFVIALHIMPSEFHFLRLVTAKKRSELPPQKSANSMLQWQFVNRNTLYAYILLLGSGVAILKASVATGLDKIIANYSGKVFTDISWHASVLLICLVTVILANIMPSVAASVIFMPYVLIMTVNADGDQWPVRAHLAALAVGMGSSLAFMCPFQYMPAHYCHSIGKVPKLQMAKYAAVSVILCTVVLWLAICFYAEQVFGILKIANDTTTMTTPKGF